MLCDACTSCIDDSAGSTIVFSTRDVICGRNTAAINNPGNQRYNLLVHEHRAEYQATRERAAKVRITQAIIQRVRRLGGRFLKYDAKESVWFEISEDYKREKVSHALRTAVDPKKKKRKMYIPLDVEAFDRGEEHTKLVCSQQPRKRRNLIGIRNPTSLWKEWNLVAPDDDSLTEIAPQVVDQGPQRIKNEIATMAPPCNIYQGADRVFSGITSAVEDLCMCDDDDLRSMLSDLMVDDHHHHDALSAEISSIIESDIPSRDGNEEQPILHIGSSFKQRTSSVDAPRPFFEVEDPNSPESGSVVKEVLELWANNYF